MSSTPTARDREAQIVNLVNRYQRQPSAVEHERLRPLIEEHFGSAAAEFFDKEERLPLTGRTGPGNYPWPMSPAESSRYTMNVMACALAAVAVVGWGLTSVLNVMAAAPIGVASGVAVWFAASPFVGRFFPPKDLAERHRLVQAYTEIQERERAEAEAEARKARDARQFRRIVEESDTEQG